MAYGDPAKRQMKVTGVIQAGGRSTRMGGRPKALIELGGSRIIERVSVVEIAEADVARFRDPRVAFMNVNTPDELERARGLATRLG